MDDRISLFWKLRSSGLVSEARLLLAKLEKTKLDEAELALMQNSLLRADRGAVVAEAALEKLEDRGIFSSAQQFQLHYQKACNSYAQGHYAEALEQLLKLGKPTDPWSRMMSLTTRLICLDCLGFEFEDLADEIKKELAKCKDPDLVAAAMPSYLGVKARQYFRAGQWQELFALKTESSWSQLVYFQSWVASLPLIDLTKLKKDPTTFVQQSLQKLTSDPDFYLRNYRLQTLVGRAYVAPKDTPTSWGDRADRLYLWTWRWLV
ncbi:MAG: hypothetical protein EOP06_09090, partial [Proteobacteria bacterium]